MILAIDPGNTHSGWCVMDEHYRPIAFGKDANGYVVAKIALPEHPISMVVIERVASFGMPVGREVFETCEWIGRLSQVAEENRIPVEYVYRKDEKLALCNSPRATDANIRHALIDRFAKHDFRSGKGTKADPDWFYGVRSDVWSAIAVGVTWLDTRGRSAALEAI